MKVVIDNYNSGVVVKSKDFKGIGSLVTIKLHDENGNEILQSGFVVEILETEQESEIKFWQNHLAYLHVKLLNEMTDNKDTTETKRRIKNAEFELSLAFEELT